MLNRKERCFIFENVSFVWPGGREVLKGQHFSIPAGTFCLIRGASGAGKSTLLRLMNRLEDPQSGTIYYRGLSLLEYDPPLLRQKVSYLQQVPVVSDGTVRDALLAPFTFSANNRLTQPSDDKLALQLDALLLDSVRLDERAAELSVGQRQRLCFARALMTDPDVLLLDEPTASLDSESTDVVERMAQRHCDNGMTVVMVTHDGFKPHGVPVLEIHIQGGKVEVFR